MHDAIQAFTHTGYIPLNPMDPPHATFSHYLGPIQVTEGLLYLMVFMPLPPQIPLSTDNIHSICQFLEFRDQAHLSQVSREFRVLLYKNLHTIKTIFATNEFLSDVIDKVDDFGIDSYDVVINDADGENRVEVMFDLNQSWTDLFKTGAFQQEHTANHWCEALQISGRILSEGTNALGKSLEIQVDSTVPILMTILPGIPYRGFYQWINPWDPVDPFMECSGKISLAFPEHGSNVKIFHNDREEIIQLNPEQYLQLAFADDMNDHQVSLKWKWKKSEP